MGKSFESRVSVEGQDSERRIQIRNDGSVDDLPDRQVKIRKVRSTQNLHE